MVTEEALPNYSVSLEHIVKDSDRDHRHSLGTWLRGWTAEENRHGDLLNAYLRLTGRVDMRSVEQTVHHLIRGGFDPGPQGDDYARADLRVVPGTSDPDHHTATSAGSPLNRGTTTSPGSAARSPATRRGTRRFTRGSSVR